jgi:hypothetical protein
LKRKVCKKNKKELEVKDKVAGTWKWRDSGTRQILQTFSCISFQLYAKHN